MVLSDGRLRERYDRQMEQWERERRMREKMMEEEREWMVERGMMGEENKFAKDPVYRKKAEVRDDDGTNKFRTFRPPPQEQGFGARPLEIDEEAEARNARRERDALVREKAEAEAQLAQEQRRQQVDRQRQREERRRASSERDVIQDSSRPTATGQDMNALMADMKQRFAEKKTDEASRVNDELTRVGTVLATATQTMPKIEPPIAPKRKKLTIVGITSFINSAGSWMSWMYDCTTVLEPPKRPLRNWTNTKNPAAHGTHPRVDEITRGTALVRDRAGAQ